MIRLFIFLLHMLATPLAAAQDGGGYLSSGGSAANVTLGQQIATSGIANNRQLHLAEAELIRKNASKFAKQMGISDDEAIALLTAEALRRVDDTYRGHLENSAASAFLDTLEAGTIISGTDQRLFVAEGAQYENSALNSRYMLANEDLYRLSSTAFAQVPGNLIFGAFNVGLAGVWEDQDLSTADIVALQQNVASLSSDEIAQLFKNHSYNDGFGDTNFAAQMASFHLVMGGLGHTAKSISAAALGTAQGIGQLHEDHAIVLSEVENILTKQAHGETLSVDEEALLFEFNLAGAQILASGGSGFNSRALRNLAAKTFRNNRLQEVVGGDSKAKNGRLPRGYTRNADGSYTGPGGGIARDTGHVDANGNMILRRDSGGYYSVDANGNQVSVSSPYTDGAPPIHHVCTNKNCTSTASGGPWTPRFEEFFDNAGLNINS